ncbi:MAG: hypothetical protein RBG13Loki_2195 [Promethearchaeota archaeon CR_4]|nr:MAG: hypothetical protein RBG13Loki_2195 [Candidatus Lokiarchaeota archaeon CR_4]
MKSFRFDFSLRHDECCIVLILGFPAFQYVANDHLPLLEFINPNNLKAGDLANLQKPCLSLFRGGDQA